MLKYKYLHLNIDDSTKKIKAEIREDEELEGLIDIDIPPPNSEKSGMYLNIIQYEYELITNKISSYIKSENNISSLEMNALKNIHELKELAKHTHDYSRKLNTTQDIESNKYIVNILKLYITRLIRRVQDIFSDFIEISIESEVMLRYDLYGENHESFFFNHSIFTLLKSEKREKLIDYLKKKKWHNVGESIFCFYTTELKLDVEKLKIEKLFWEQAIITQKLKVRYFEKYINHPQIENILIPLISKQLEYLGEQNKVIQKADKIYNINEISNAEFK